MNGERQTIRFETADSCVAHCCGKSLRATNTDLPGRKPQKAGMRIPRANAGSSGVHRLSRRLACTWDQPGLRPGDMSRSRSVMMSRVNCRKPAAKNMRPLLREQCLFCLIVRVRKCDGPRAVGEARLSDKSLLGRCKTGNSCASGLPAHLFMGPKSRHLRAINRWSSRHNIVI
jgi:hypothetical protein